MFSVVDRKVFNISLTTLSWPFTSLSLLTLKTYIKRIGGSNLVDFNGGFSYIISSWSTEEG